MVMVQLRLFRIGTHHSLLREYHSTQPGRFSPPAPTSIKKAKHFRKFLFEPTFYTKKNVYGGSMPFPSPADDYLEPRLSLDDLIVHPATTFFVRLTGGSMEPTLHHADILFVEQALVPLVGQTGVVVFQKKFLVRRIVTHDDKIILMADNQACVDIV